MLTAVVSVSRATTPAYPPESQDTLLPRNSEQSIEDVLVPSALLQGKSGEGREGREGREEREGGEGGKEGREGGRGGRSQI